MTVTGFFAQSIRDYLGISNELKMMFAIAFGNPDLTSPIHRSRLGRAPSQRA
jgi:hypothetical protein